MKSTSETGLKITRAQREHFRYTGQSAEAERSGKGGSRPELAFEERQRRIEEEKNPPDSRQVSHEDAK